MMQRWLFLAGGLRLLWLSRSLSGDDRRVAILGGLRHIACSVYAWRRLYLSLTSRDLCRWLEATGWEVVPPQHPLEILDAWEVVDGQHREGRSVGPALPLRRHRQATSSGTGCPAASPSG